jgi:hypothetical protein
VESSFFCDLKAFNQLERKRHDELTRQLFHSVTSSTELANGFSYEMPSGSLSAFAEWVSYERRCCPFLVFEIEAGNASKPLRLRLTGPEGVKKFIQSASPLTGLWFWRAGMAQSLIHAIARCVPGCDACASQQILP